MNISPLTPALAALRIDGDRMMRRIRDLGELGAIRGANGEPGSARLALTDDERPRPRQNLDGRSRS
jgi:hypothetical protein